MKSFESLMIEHPTHFINNGFVLRSKNQERPATSCTTSLICDLSSVSEL